MNRPRQVRSGVGLLACLLAFGCAPQTSWTIRKPLAAFTLPRETTIMVFREPEVEALDTHGVTDALTRALREQLEEQGVTSALTALQGEPRVPRIELAFRRLEVKSTSQYSDSTQSFEDVSLVVDVGVVSQLDEVVFVGRFVSSAPRERIKLAATEAGRKIAQDLRAAK